MSINVDAAWDALGQAVGTITGLNVFDFVPDSLQPPAAVVTLDEITYDYSMKRGSDRAVFKVWIAVGKVHDQSSRDKLAGYMNSAGTTTTSVKAAVDAMGPQVRCGRGSIQVLGEAGQEFLAAVFDVDYVA